MDELTDLDGCPRACRVVHTMIWGKCKKAPESARPEPLIAISARSFVVADGYRAAGVNLYTLAQLTERIERAQRSVPITLDPNARAMTERGETARLSGDEYWAMANAVARALMNLDKED